MSSDTVKDLTPSRENNVDTENKDEHIGNNGGTEILSKNQRKKLLRHQKWEEERNLRKSVTLACLPGNPTLNCIEVYVGQNLAFESERFLLTTSLQAFNTIKLLLYRLSVRLMLLQVGMYN